MALINCPECSKKISDQSVSCPNCGYPVKQNVVSSPSLNPKTAQAKTIKEDKTPSPFMAVVGIFILVFMMAQCSSDDSSNSESERTILNVSEACSLFNTEMTSWKSSNNDGVYRCISNYIDVSPETNAKIPNNVAYYVEGRENSVTELKVVMNINIPKYKTKSTNEFIKMADALYSRVNNQPLPAEITSAIKSKKAYENNDGKLTYNVEYEKNGSVETQKLIIRLL